MNPSLIIAGIPFYDTPTEVEGSPYWVDLWADVNGHKIGLQVKPTTYNSPNVVAYMGRSKSSEELGHRKFRDDFGGDVFIITPKNGTVSPQMERRIRAYYDRLLDLPSKKST